MSGSGGGVTVDLLDVPVVDNHCHSVDRAQDHPDLAGWRALFSESPDPPTRTVDVAGTACYQRLIARMGAYWGVPPEEEAVLAARAGTSRDAGELTGRLLGSAGVAALVVDTGYPDPATALSVAELGRALGRPVAALLRLEPTFERLLGTTADYDELVDAVRHTVTDARGQGWAGLKTVAGYRTGLAIDRWDPADVRTAYASARAEVDADRRVRLGHKPLLDTLLHEVFAIAAAEELPVQVHVGYGDPDVDLRLAHPLLLRSVFEDPAYRGMPVVLLHGCWPYVREGAFLAAVYGNAWLDLSYGIPYLSAAELRELTRAALGAAPSSRLLYSSDGARVPELHWMGAVDGRRSLAAALAEQVLDGDLTPDQARRTGERVLRDNAWALYDLGAGG